MFDVFALIKMGWLQNNASYLINNTKKLIQNKSKQVAAAANDENKNEIQEKETITFKRPLCDYADKSILYKAAQNLYRLQTQRN